MCVVVLVIDTSLATLCENSTLVGVILKNGFVHFVNSFSFCLIDLETFLEENKGARFRDISPQRK